jgi:pimeloyl-ACP methyl ester carboxylesterase/DNA-binding CsgD family transcriptional regulator
LSSSESCCSRSSGRPHLFATVGGLSVTRFERHAPRQRIHIARTPDNVRLAWAQAGTGPVLVKASNWLTHLQYDWESPVWRHWMMFLADHFHFVRFDERGCGMSDWEVADVSESNWLGDLECVIEAAGIDRPMILLGVSQGAVTVIRYAAKHPERVSHLILYGGYAHGWMRRGTPQEQHYHAILEMMRLGWGSRNPVFRQAFTGRFIPDATHEQLDWFNELCRKTTAPEMAVRLLETRGHVDVTDLLDQVQVPTLVIHARGDEVVPFSEGRKLASRIPGAEFVELDSSNHILLSDESAWQEFKRVVLEFTGVPIQEKKHPDFTTLTRREKQILELVSRGLSNAGIAEKLYVSEKTVRNHLTRIYRKLGVSSRTQAIALLADGAAR